MNNLTQLDKKVWTDPVYFLAFGFGSGTLPWMPGTFGTLIAIPLYLLMRDLSLFSYAIILLILILGGIWICDKVVKETGLPDYKGIVWDEIVGYLVTMCLAPTGWLWLVLGFILFRLFDIWKPWPIGLIDDKVSGGLGVVLDDLLAGVFAGLALLICVQLSARF